MRRVLSLVMVVLMLAACDGDDPSEPRDIQIVGDYTLETINGQQLPVWIGSAFGALLMQQVGGSFSIKQNGTSEEEALVRFYTNDPERGIVFDEDTLRFPGVWQAEDSVVLVTSADDVLFGFVSANRLTLSVELGDSLYTYIYRRD